MRSRVVKRCARDSDYKFEFNGDGRQKPFSLRPLPSLQKKELASRWVKQGFLYFSRGLGSVVVLLTYKL
jgi:hypothetical protein